jgi:hypothetical protein
MQHLTNSIQSSRRESWNKGKLVGAKPPLRPKHVWSIRTKLQIVGRTRDLAMFNLAIDSKLRGCDVVGLRVEDGFSWSRCRSCDHTPKKARPAGQIQHDGADREAVDSYIAAANKKPGQFLFSDSRCRDRPIRRGSMRGWSGSGSPA